jgi:hypothetical protein
VIAVISTTWELRALAGAVFGNGQPLRTREAPEVDRVYLAVQMLVEHETSRWINDDDDDLKIHYFHSQAGAEEWTEGDIRRRLFDGEVE